MLYTLNVQLLKVGNWDTYKHPKGLNTQKCYCMKMIQKGEPLTAKKEDLDVPCQSFHPGLYDVERDKTVFWFIYSVCSCILKQSS